MTDSWTAWRKSTRSNASMTCVEVAQRRDGAVGVRDSKHDAPGPILTVSPPGWRAFVDAVRADGLQPPA
ncbi:MAG TPA: DUF397 domain-containing protein [Actinocatenispora sp.]